MKTLNFLWMWTSCCMLMPLTTDNDKDIFHVMRRTIFLQMFTWWLSFHTMTCRNTTCIILTSLTCQLTLQWSPVKQQTPAKLHIRKHVVATLSAPHRASRMRQQQPTYSRYLVHGAGSDMAMKKQLVSIVNIMNRLNNVERRLRNITR